MSGPWLRTCGSRSREGSGFLSRKIAAGRAKSGHREPENRPPRAALVRDYAADLFHTARGYCQPKPGNGIPLLGGNERQINLLVDIRRDAATIVDYGNRNPL